MSDISTTFAKGLLVLEAFDGRALSMPQIVENTGLDRASVRRLVLTLEARGYLTRDDARSFMLTPKVLGLAGSYLQGRRIGAVVQPVLNRVASELGTAVSLAMRDGLHAVYVGQSSLATSQISIGFTVGSHLPLLQTAMGRMLLAFGGDAEREAALRDAPLERFTPKSQMDRTRIARAISQAAQEGFCLARDEFEPGVAGLAVPIGAPERASGALGLSLPLDGLARDDQIAGYVAQLRAAALEIAQTKALE